MNEDFLNGIYNEHFSNIDRDVFDKLISNNSDFQKSIYDDHFSNIDRDVFDSLIGSKKKDSTIQEQPQKENLQSGSLEGTSSSQSSTQQSSGLVDVNGKPIEGYNEDLNIDTRQPKIEVPKLTEEMKQQADKESAERKLIAKSIDNKAILNYPAEDLVQLYDALDDNAKKVIEDRGGKNLFIDDLKEKQDRALVAESDKHYNEAYKQYLDPVLTKGMTPSEADTFAKKRYGMDRAKFALERIGDYANLSGDELVQLQDVSSKLSMLNDALNKKRSNNEQPTEQELEQLAEYNQQIAGFLDRPKGNLINPETGNFDEQYTKEVEALSGDIATKYDNDYMKLDRRRNELMNQVMYLRDKSADLTYKIGDKQMPIVKIDGASVYSSGRFENSSDELKAKAIVEQYKKVMTEFDAINRALLLNEDVNRLSPKGLWENVGSLFTSAAEGAVEYGVFGINKNITSDKDFRTNVLQFAKNAGVNISDEAIKEAAPSFVEKLGETLGTSTGVGLEIAAVGGLLSGAELAAAKAFPKVAARLATVADKYPKYAKAGEKIYETLRSGVAYDLASENTDFAMGAAEKGASDIFEAIADKMAKGKLGVWGNMMTRLSGAIVGGTVEEYAGDLASNLSEFGFTDKAFKETFGEGEDAWEKFFLTAASAGMFAAPTEVITAIGKNIENKRAKGEQKEADELQTLLDNYEEVQNDKQTITKEEADAMFAPSDEKGTEGLTESDKAELDKIAEEYKNDKEVSGEEVPSTVGEGQKPGDIQVNEGSQEATTTSGVLQENEVDSTEPGVLEKAISWVQQAQTDLDNFGKGNLSMGVPVVAAKAFLKAVEVSLKAGLSLKQAIENYKKSDEFNNLSDADKASINSIDENNIGDLLKSDYQSYLEKAGLSPDAAKEKAAQFVENKKKSQEKSDLGKSALDTFNKSQQEQGDIEVAQEAGIKHLERSKLYQSLSPSDKATILNSYLEATTKKSKPKVKDTSEKVTITKKQGLLYKLRTESKASLAAGKSIADVKKQMMQQIKGLNLTKNQLEQVAKVLSKVSNDNLNDNLKKIENIVNYGKPNPTTAEILAGKPEETTELTEKQLTEILNKTAEKAGKQAIKGNSKALVDLVKSTGIKLSKLNAVERARLLGITKNALKTDLSQNGNLENVKAQLENLVKNSEYRAYTNNISKKQNILRKAAKKKLNGRARNLAEVVSKIDPRKVEDVDMLNKLVDNLIGSAKGDKSLNETTDIVTLNEQVAQLELEQQEYNKKKEEEAAKKYEEDLKKSYDESMYSYIMSFDEYKNMIDTQNEIREANKEAEKAKKKVADELKKELEKEERKKEIKQLFKDSLPRLKEYAKGDLTESQKKYLDGIIKFLSSDSNVESLFEDPKLLTDTLISLDQILTFGNTAGIQNTAAVLESVNKGKDVSSLGKVFSKGKFKDYFLSGAIKAVSDIDSVIRLFSEYSDRGDHFTAKVLGSFDNSFNKVVMATNKFNEELERLVSMANLGNTTTKDIAKKQLMGMYSFLSQDAIGAAPGKWYDFKERKDKIKQQIEEFKKVDGTIKLAEVLEEQFSKLEKYKSVEEMEADINNIFNKKEQDIINFVRESFVDVEPRLNQSLMDSKGKTFTSYTNYAPLVEKRTVLKKKAKELEKNRVDSLDTKSAGTTIDRQKSDVFYNFDFIETSKKGYYDSLYDIETLYDRKVLKDLIESKPYQEVFKNKQGNLNDIPLGVINERIRQLASNRLPRGAADSAANLSNYKKVYKAFDFIYRSAMALPLRHVFQWGQQGLVIAASFIKNPINTMKSLALFAANNKLFFNIIKGSASEYRGGGGVGLDKSTSLILRGLTKLPYIGNMKGNSNLVARSYNNVFNEGLVHVDKFANNITFVAEYLNELSKRKQKLSDKIDSEVHAIAQTRANQINNNSDPTRQGDFFGVSDDSNLKTVAKMLFLYKSFSANLTVNALNSLGKILKGKNPLREARFIAGAATSAVLFNAFKDLFIKDVIVKPLAESIANVDFKDDEEEREWFDKTLKESSKGLYDVFFGGLPTVFEPLAFKSLEGTYDELHNVFYDAGLIENETPDNPFNYSRPGSAGSIGMVFDMFQNIKTPVQTVLNDDSLDKGQKIVLISLFVSIIIGEGTGYRISKPIAKKIVDNSEYNKESN